MKKWILVLFVANFISLSALADWFVEPSLGYNIGTFDFSATALGLPVTATGSANGIGLGAKAGYSITMFYFGADLGYNMIKINDDSATGSDSNSTQFNLGIVAGVDLILVRAWLGYVASSTMASDTSNDQKFTGGSGFKIGAGYKVIPMVSLNLEYTILTYDKEEVNTPSVYTFGELENSSLMLSVSVPLSI